MQVQLHTQTETQAEGLVCAGTETDNRDWCVHAPSSWAKILEKRRGCTISLGGFPLAVEIIPGRFDGAACCFKTQADCCIIILL